MDSEHHWGGVTEVTTQISTDALQPEIPPGHQIFHQANSNELFRLCSVDLKTSSTVRLTNNISLGNVKNVLSAIREHFSLGQRSSFQNRSLFHTHSPTPPHPPSSLSLSLSAVEVSVIMSAIYVNRMISKC